MLPRLYRPLLPLAQQAALLAHVQVFWAAQACFVSPEYNAPAI